MSSPQPRGLTGRSTHEMAANSTSKTILLLIYVSIVSAHIKCCIILNIS